MLAPSRALTLAPILTLLACGGARPLSPSLRGDYYRAPAPESLSTSAGASAQEPRAEAGRPGLGTHFGEDRYAPVHDTTFERAGGPLHVATIRYDDHEGIQALRARADLRPCAAGEPLLPAFTPAIIVEVVDEAGRPLPAYCGSPVLVEGEAGRRYAIRVQNRGPGRIEVVASVDGLDVIDGRSASPDKRGYVVGPYGRLLIEGFRRSMREVAAFRFGSVRGSYADLTAETGDRNVGVIGVALFTERGTDWAALDREAARREQADPFPGRFAQPPL